MMWFPGKLKTTKLDSFVNSSGISPDKLFPERSMLMTRERILVNSRDWPFMLTTTLSS